MAGRNYLQKIYDINPDTGNYMLQVLVDDYNGIFYNLDNAPLYKRDINPDIEDFLFDCSMDIPFRYDIDIKFNLKQEKREESREETIRSGFKTYCSFYLRSSIKHLRRSYYQVAQYFLISFMLLFTGFLLEDRLSKGIIYNVLMEGLRIGGWVFLWQAIVFFMEERKELSEKIKILKRLLNSHIYFQSGKK